MTEEVLTLTAFRKQMMENLTLGTFCEKVKPKRTKVLKPASVTVYCSTVENLMKDLGNQGNISIPAIRDTDKMKKLVEGRTSKQKANAFAALSKTLICFGHSECSAREIYDYWCKRSRRSAEGENDAQTELKQEEKEIIENTMPISDLIKQNERRAVDRRAATATRLRAQENVALLWLGCELCPRIGSLLELHTIDDGKTNFVDLLTGKVLMRQHKRSATDGAREVGPLSPGALVAIKKLVEMRNEMFTDLPEKFRTHVFCQSRLWQKKREYKSYSLQNMTQMVKKMFQNTGMRFSLLRKIYASTNANLADASSVQTVAKKLLHSMDTSARHYIKAAPKAGVAMLSKPKESKTKPKSDTKESKRMMESESEESLYPSDSWDHNPSDSDANKSEPEKKRKEPVPKTKKQSKKENTNSKKRKV